MKFSKPFYGVPDGEFYPVQYEAGEECPKDLESAAIAQAAVDQDKKSTAKTQK